MVSEPESFRLLAENIPDNLWLKRMNSGIRKVIDGVFNKIVSVLEGKDC